MNTTQDWAPVVLRKSKPFAPRPVPSGPQKEVGIEEKRIKKYSRELSESVIEARCRMSISQAELAKRCNVLSSLVNQVESRKGVYEPELVNKILKVLNLSVAKRWEN